MDSIFFTGWSSIARIVVVGIGAYLAVVVALRIAGKQSLAKRSAYGMVVTVALGSVLAAAILSPETGLVGGVTAIALLLGLQFVLSFAGSRFERVRHMTTNRPELLLRDGRMDEEALSRERVTVAEIHSAVRREGFGSLEDVAAIVLETDGTLSVIGTLGNSGSALEDVGGSDEKKSDRRQKRE